MIIYALIKEEVMKEWNFFSHDERHEAPFKFNNRFILVKIAIEMCTHIGNAIMYHVYENKILFFNKLFSLLQTCSCSLHATFFYNTHLTCCQREVLSNFFGHL